MTQESQRETQDLETTQRPPTMKRDMDDGVLGCSRARDKCKGKGKSEITNEINLLDFYQRDQSYDFNKASQNGTDPSFKQVEHDVDQDDKGMDQ